MRLTRRARDRCPPSPYDGRMAGPAMPGRSKLITTSPGENQPLRASRPLQHHACIACSASQIREPPGDSSAVQRRGVRATEPLGARAPRMRPRTTLRMCGGAGGACAWAGRSAEFLGAAGGGRLPRVLRRGGALCGPAARARSGLRRCWRRCACRAPTRAKMPYRGLHQQRAGVRSS